MTKEIVDQQCSEIIDFLRKAELEKAIESLLSYSDVLESESHKRSVVLLSARFETFKKKSINDETIEEEEDNKIYQATYNLATQAKEYYYEEYNFIAIQKKEENEKDAEIKRLKEQINKLKLESLQDIYVPPNYAVELSEEYGFGLAFPENWDFHKMTGSINYGSFIDLENDISLNVHIDDLSGLEIGLEEVYNITAQNITNILNQVEIDEHKHQMIKGNPGSILLGSCMIDDRRNIIYRYCFTDRNQSKLFILSFVCLPETFETKRPVFDTIANLFKVG